MRFFIIGLVLMAILFFSCSCMGEITQADLHNFAKSAIENGDFASTPPRFDWGGEYLVYSLGEIDIPEEILSPDLVVPLQAQMKIALIEKARNTRSQRKFWQPMLRRAGQLVGRMVEVVNNRDLNEEMRMNTLYQMDRQINEMYQSVLDVHAKRRGKKGAQVAAMEARMEPYRVEFICNPVGGKVNVVSLGKWKLYQFLKSKGIPVGDLDWNTVYGTVELLGGKYQVHCDWPGGQVCDDDIHVTHTGQKIMVMPDY